MRAAVIGAGAWGTALADLLARNGHAVRLWAHEPDVVTAINTRHENARFLAGAPVAESVLATDELDHASEGAECVVYVTPSHVLRMVVRASRPAVPPNAMLMVASKGIELGTLATMTAIVREEMPEHDVVVLSGPSFAREVVARQPTAVVAASRRFDAATRAQCAFSSPNFRVYTHDDVIGVELGGALKNVIAVGTGIAEGLGLGYNPRAALITRGLAEITRLGLALGASASTFAGLAGMGDLVLTCTGALSRNRSLGFEIGEGATLSDILATRETVAEGVLTTQSAFALAARADVETPIIAAVHRILFEQQPPRLAISELMARELRAEQD
ncbi:MAG TPA: NAD(P)H-dependent glycerol-3-phosphate dehydrogenase [Gemmatimonadaceae bacterium]|nr:NAD(P)H-dependent glycerol-3-phosphate dehydrogenase [Gemmatimonadaceae bacterium]